MPCSEVTFSIKGKSFLLYCDCWRCTRCGFLHKPSQYRLYDSLAVLLVELLMPWQCAQCCHLCGGFSAHLGLPTSSPFLLMWCRVCGLSATISCLWLLGHFWDCGFRVLTGSFSWNITQDLLSAVALQGTPASCAGQPWWRLGFGLEPVQLGFQVDVKFCWAS